MALETHPLLTAAVLAWIGRATEAVALPEPIAASDVRRYVAATDDANPLYLDEAFARAAGYRSRVVPPLLLLDLPWRVDGGFENDIRYQVPLPAHYTDTRNGGNEAEWLAPVCVGDQLTVQHRIADIRVREGRAGTGVHMTKETELCNQLGEIVLRVRQTNIRFPGGASKTPPVVP